MDKYNKDPISEVSKFCLIVEKLHYVFTYFSIHTRSTYNYFIIDKMGWEVKGKILWL